jgi:hypothetical protein
MRCSTPVSGEIFSAPCTSVVHRYWSFSFVNMQVFPRTTTVHIAVTNNTVARMGIQPVHLRCTPLVRTFSMIMRKLSNLISLSCDSPTTVDDLRLIPLSTFRFNPSSSVPVYCDNGLQTCVCGLGVPATLCLPLPPQSDCGHVTVTSDDRLTPSTSSTLLYQQRAAPLARYGLL